MLVNMLIKLTPDDITVILTKLNKAMAFLVRYRMTSHFFTLL